LTDLKAAWSLDESSGNANDASGNGYTLSNTNITYSGTNPLINNHAVFNASTGRYFTNASLASWNPTYLL
jgi:hypothetical protein